MAIDLKAEVYLGTWTDASNYVYQRDPVQFTMGRQGSSTQLSPSTATFTLNNRDARWTIRNPTGPWYGTILQNSPIRFSVPSSLAGIPTYLRLETDTLSDCSAPDSGSFSTPAVVQQKSNHNSGLTTLTVTLTSATTAGNCLVVAATLANTGVTNQTITGVTLGGVADHFGASAAFVSGVGSSGRTEFWIDPNCAGGQTAVQITLSTSTGVITNAHVFEVSGVALTSPLDQHDSGAGAWTSGTSFSSGATGTTAQAKEIAVGVVVEFTATGPPTISGPSSPWVNVTQENNNFSGSNFVSSVAGTNILSPTGTQTYSGTSTITNAGAGRASVITLKAASTGGLQITSGTISARVDCKITDWIGNHVLFAKWGATGQSWGMWTNGTGTIEWAIFDGTNNYFTSSKIPIPYFGNRIAIRVDYTIATGSTTFYWAPTMSGSWTQFGPTSIVQTAGSIPTTPTSISGAPGQAVQVGNGTTTLPGTYGEFYEAQLISTGVTIADPVFTSQTIGVSSFVDAQSNTWTLSGTAELSGRSYRYCGELTSLPKTSDNTAKDLYIPGQAFGVLSRVQQQSSPTNSAMYRAYVRLPSNLNLAAYWPAEDGSTTNVVTSFSGRPSQISPAVGQFPMSNVNLTMSSFTGFPSSDGLPVMNGGTASALVDPNSVTWNDNVVRFLLAVPIGDDTNNAVIARMFTTGSVARLDLVYGTGGVLQLNGYNAAGTVIGSAQVGPFTFGLTGATGLANCRVSIEIRGNGTTGLWVTTPGTPIFGGGGTWSGTLGAVTNVAFGGGLVNSAMGHFSVQGTWDTLADLQQPMNAWLGETAGARYSRLCGEENIACRIIGPPDKSVPMGYQLIESIEQLLQEIENTDLGLQVEPRWNLGLGYITNWALCNQPVDLTLDYSLAQLLPFVPTSDTQQIINDVTYTGLDGSSARQILSTGSMSVNAPPNGIGRFDTIQQSNPKQDAVLSSLAQWQLHIKSADEDRYPALPVDMTRSATPLAASILADIGAYVQVINPDTWVPTGPVRQLVAGYTETFMPQPWWEIDFNTYPEAPYEVCVADDTVYGRVDTAGSALHTGVASGTTTMVVDTTSGPTWSTNSGDYPMDISMGGERITWNTAPGGSTSPQTFTGVTRSVNGVVKSHVAGENIDLWFPPFLAFY